MKKSSITFLLFGPVLCPGGGMKIILEYANRLVKDGYNVNIVYPATLNWSKRDLKYKLKSIYHYFRHEILGWKCNRWFDLDPRVRELHTFSLNFRDIPRSDIYIATEVRTAPYVAGYPVSESKKFYFIQDFEDWFVSDSFVINTYYLPLNKITISHWLHKKLNALGLTSNIVPNAFDFEYFKMYNPIENRNRNIIAILYHEAPRKDCKLALETLDIVHKKYPQIKVLAFGTPERPKDMPSWYEYYRQPDKETHNMIYNEAAIFIGSSKVEGWGLTVGEAMICGAAIACTDIDGYKEMVEDGKNSLISPIHDAEAMAANIIRLIENDEFRIKLAIQGNADIQIFNWGNSYKLMLSALNLA